MDRLIYHVLYVRHAGFGKYVVFLVVHVSYVLLVCQVSPISVNLKAIFYKILTE